MTTPSDPLYSSQWHFALIGNIETIWDEYTGNNINVGVYDDGVESGHEDLSGNYNASLHYSGIGSDDGQPNSGSAGHGTACAGIIGASNNGVGGVGIAYDVNLTGIDFLGDLQYASYSVVMDSLSYAQNFDIVSNSWGGDPLFQPYTDMGDTGSYRANMIDAWGDAVDLGRGGLGTIITKAAGNDTLNASGDGLNGTRYSITVAATDSSGDVASYSNYGSAILIAAPAAAVTSDRSGSDGYSSGNYTTTFGGTSAATPVISGVAALMLSANDNLGWRDVQNILAISASQTGSAYGSTASYGSEVGNWGQNGAGNWNGGGMSYHLSYGYGMVDAFAAVRMAEVWDTMFAEGPLTSINEITHSAANGSVVTIPDLSTITSDIIIAANDSISIEHIDVTINLTHTYFGDLVIYLIGPNGDAIPLYLNDSVSSDGGSTILGGTFEYTFGVTAALGMLSEGTWTLSVADTLSGDSGTLLDFEIQFYGTTIVSNDVHHFTSDFAELAAVDAARSVVSDTNGGTDWLNFSAVEEDLIINMAAGGAFSVDGTSWGTLATGADVFENIVASDGNDQITGNSLNNRILGMRGNDTLIGAGGKDTLEGGAGNDVLIGGAGNDKLFGGSGNDTADYSAETSGIVVTNGSSVTGSGIGTDTLKKITKILGGSGDDVMTGGNSKNSFYGNGGNDIIDGAGGNDKLFGGAGNDTLIGGTGNDVLIGGSGNDTADYSAETSGIVVTNGSSVTGSGIGTDTLKKITNIIGGSGDDSIEGGNSKNSLSGGDGNDMLFGGGGNDKLFGGAGNDTLVGGTGNDQIYGGTGSDTVDYSSDTLGITVTAGSSATGAGIGTDKLKKIANIIGGSGDDDITGGNSKNALFGGAGADTLDGSGGNDTLYGGADNDTLTGGAGADTFVFVSGDGDDTITDFDIGTDTLNLSDFGFSNFNDLLAATNDTIGGTTITLSGGGSIFLDGITEASLISGDFIL